MAIKKILLSLVLLLSACSISKREEPCAKKPLLLVSIPPYQSMVQRIAGEEFDVVAVVPSNANPHSYEPTSKQVAGLKNGAIWFQIGEPFEKKVAHLLKETLVVDLRQGVSMIDNETHHCHACGQDHLDRHIWLSPKQAALQADHITTILCEKYPDKKEGFILHSNELKGDLAELNREIESILKSTNARSFLVSHPAFAYFCRDFDLTQLSVEHEGKDPRPKELEAVYKQAIDAAAEIAIALPQHNNKGAQLIAEKLQIPVRVIDPYSAEYFETMRTLAGWIANPYKSDE